MENIPHHHSNTASLLDGTTNPWIHCFPDPTFCILQEEE